MLSTADERRTAVRLARHTLESGRFDLIEPDTVKLLCSTLLDCHTVFTLHAPVIAAAKQCVRPDGSFTMSGPCWTELREGVRALRKEEGQP